MNKKILVLISLVIVFVVFYAGYFYGKSKIPANQLSGFRNGGQMMGGMSSNGQRAFRQGNNMIFGEVISKDSNSITLKDRDGGSKIIFFMSSTTISKMMPVSINDIQTGSQISVTGTTNSDGSISATSIQESPRRSN